MKIKFNEYPLNVPSFNDIEKEFIILLNEFENSSTPEEQKQFMLKITDLFDEIQTDFTIITVRHSIDTKNEEYKKAKDQIDEVGPLIQSLGHRYSMSVLNSKFKNELEKLVGSFLYRKLELSAKTFNDSIIEDLQLENKLTTEYENLLASAEIKYDGQIYNLAQMGKFVEDVDRNVRKMSSKAVEKWMCENEITFIEIYSKLVTLRTSIAKKLGYDSFIDLAYARMGRTDWNSKNVEGYRDQIFKTVVPISNELVKKITHRTKIENPQFYDLNINFLDGNATPKGNTEQLIKLAIEMYDEMGVEIGQFFREMVELNLLDLEAKPGKMGGGYMTYFPRYKMPFIFSNFNGTSADIDVLTHEVGHAFQGYMSRDIVPTEYRDPTMEEAEIHSMSMEFFAMPWMKNFFSDDVDKYMLSHLEGTINFLPYGATVDEFQHWVYANPDATHEERCAMWRNIENKYTPYKKYDDFPFYEKGTRWIRQSHIFTMPFYYIDYTLAQVVALQFLALIEENYKEAWKKYVDVCSSGGLYSFTQLLEKTNLDNPFLNNNIEKTFIPIKRILERYERKFY